MSIPMQMFFANGEKVDELLGAVPEEVIRSKVDDVIERFPTDERAQLKVILSSWIEHNKQNGNKFKRWEQKAEQMKNDALYKSILEVVSDMEKTNDKLAQLWDEL
jgi:thioredoxin-like negative regulator of GroEL